MTTVSPYIGRREAVGFGIETTPGTAVPPQIWLRWLTHGLQARKNSIENESAMGVVDRVNDSATTGAWVEGSVGGKVTSEGIGFLLLGLFGSVSTGAAVSGIYPHTFSVNQSSVGTTLTTALDAPLGDRRHPYTVLDNLEITAESGGYVEVSTALKARIGASSTETPAFVAEKEFTSKDIAVRVAANTAGIGAAPDLKASRISLIMERSSEPFFPLGTTDVPEFDRTTFEARGELVLRLTDDQYETDFLANTNKALRILLTNGTTTLQFSASKVKYRELEKSRDRDGIVTVSLQYFCEFDTATGSSIVPVLSVSRATYVGV